MPQVAAARNQTIAAAHAATTDEAAAVAWWEAHRWGDCPACVHCGGLDVYKMMRRGSEERDARFRWRCRDCGKQYTVKVGTVMEGSNVPMRVWVLALWLYTSSKKGFAAKQLQRMSGLSYKSALFVAHRIRFAMADEGGEAFTGTVEVDETYVGGKPRASEKKKGRVYKRGRGTDKTPVVAVVQRGGRVVASPVASVNADNLKGAIRATVDRSARIVTDELALYKGIGSEFEGGHHTVTHRASEYVRYEEDGTVTHTNTAEGFFSLLKRGITGVYHSVSPLHLHRYVSAAAWRYSFRHMNDGERMLELLRATEGKRLANRKSAAL